MYIWIHFNSDKERNHNHSSSSWKNKNNFNSGGIIVINLRLNVSTICFVGGSCKPSSIVELSCIKSCNGGM
jgi:hypothetical protein